MKLIYGDDEFKAFILSLAILLVFVSGFGKAVSKAEVSAAVYELLEEWNRPADVEILNMDPHYLSDGSLGYYLVDLGRNGWVLVSGDDVIRPVLAFSFEKPLVVEEEWGEAAGYLLNLYKDEIRSAVKNPNLKRDVRWDGRDLPSLKSSHEDVYIDPFIEVNWNQSAGWNMFCPYDEDGPGDRAYVGCVAVSMAQAMSVYDYPASPVGMKSYVHDDYGTIAVNYDLAAPYEWDQMAKNSYDSSNAILLYHAAVSVEMGFGADGSGAYVRTAARAMKEFFSYSENLSFTMRFEDDEAWTSLLVSELEAGRPIVYRGGPDDGRSGHAWNIDGYGNGYFHMNFGWSGSQNGYFTLDLIDPGNNDFSSSQGAMIGIAPPLSMPTDISLSAEYVNEGLPVGSFVADLEVEDEDPDNTYTFECKGKFSVILDDYRPATFKIEEGKLLTDKVFDYNEERPDRNSEFLLIIVEDQYGNEFQKEFLIDIRKIYQGPTGIALSDSSVKEMQPVGTAVACIMVEDEDPDNSYTFSVSDPSLFSVDGDTLRTNVIFSLEESDTAYVVVELEDKYGFQLSSAFTISILKDQSGSTGMAPLALVNDLVYPNPAGKFINLRNAGQISSFELYEISTGRMVMREEQPGDRLDVSYLPEGTYLILIRSNEKNQAQKLVISR